MAIIIGPYASKMRGKVGEVVAAKTTGNRTALRSYQSKVKNPNTLRQRVSRNKLATASLYAAIFAKAINIGFAKAASGTKMYPRNLFVKRVVPNSAGVITYADGGVSVDPTKLIVSEEAGIPIKPILSQAQPSEGFAEKIVVENIDDYSVGTDEMLGLVVAAYNAQKKLVYVSMGDASEGVQFTDAQMSQGTSWNFYGFVKVIPAAINGVPTEEIPWKYPSATSATAKV